MRRVPILRVVAALVAVAGLSALLAWSCDGSSGPVVSPPGIVADAATTESIGATERRRVRVAEPSPSVTSPSSAAEEAGTPDEHRAEIVVVVTGPDGGPVTAAVAAFVPEGNDEEMPQADLDATGRAVLRPLVGTTGSVAVVARDLTSWESGALVVHPEGCRIEVSLGAGLIVEGVVVARDGVTLVPDAPIVIAAYPDDRTLELLARGLGSRIVTTDSAGRFRVDGLRDGAVRLAAYLPPARSDLGERGDAVVDAGATDVRIVLWRTKSVQFVPVDIATGLAPRCVSLELVEVFEGEERSRYRQSTTADAPSGAPTPIPRRAIRVAGHDIRTFRVRATGYAPSEVVEVDPNAGPAAEEIRIELTPDPASAATLRLWVETEDGDVPTFVVVTTFSADRGTSTGRRHRTAGGAIEVELAPGPALLSVEGRVPGGIGVDHPWLSVDVELDVPRGAVLDQRVVLQAGGFVRVVGAPEGASLPPTAAMVGDADATPIWLHWSREVAAGRFLSHALPPGDYEIRWGGRGWDDSPPPQSFVVRPREVTEIRWPAD